MSLPPEFRDALRGFVELGIKLLQEYVHAGIALPGHTHRTPFRQGPNTWSYKETVTPDWQLILFKVQESLVAFAEYQACIGIMTDTPDIARHLHQLIYFGGQGTQFDPERVLFGFLSRMLWGQEKPDFDEPQFRSAYDDLEAFLIEDRAEFEIWAPLENLQCLGDPVPLGTGIAIKQTPEELFDSIFHVSEYGFRLERVMHWESTLHVTFLFTKKIGARTEGEPNDDKYQISFDALTALRLFKSQRVAAGTIAIRPKRRLPISYGISYTTPSANRILGPTKYVICVEDGPELTRIYGLVRGLDSEKFSALALAIRRFNMSYDRRFPEDRLIDQMIAFEALYLADINEDDRGELRFRLALRVSYFLETGVGRSHVYKDMRRAYDVRSAIVHGGSPELPSVAGTSISIGDFADKIEGYLRRSLVRFLDLAHQPGASKQLARWDDLLFPDSETSS